MFFCRILPFQLFIWPLFLGLLCLSVSASEVAFTGHINAKEYRLVWGSHFSNAKLYINRGREGGYPLEKQDGLWIVDLTNDHRLTFKLNEESDYTQIVVREERKGKYGYFAWSQSQQDPSQIYFHNLTTFTDLPKQDQLESAVGQGFDFKKVMRVPYTDRFVELTEKTSKSTQYLRCEYLSKLMGTPAASRDCLAFERMTKLLGQLDIAQGQCSSIVYGEDLSFSGLWERLGDFENCLRPLAAINTGCLRGFLKQGRSLLRCEHSMEVTPNEIVDVDFAKNYLMDQLATYESSSLQYEDESILKPVEVKVSSSALDKIYLSQCYYQYLANSQNRDGVEEAFNSCLYSLESSKKSPAPSMLFALSKWIINSLTNSGQSVGFKELSRPTDLAQSLAEKIRPTSKISFHDLPMPGHSMQGLSQHYWDYAHHLLGRGWLDYSLKKQISSEESHYLRAPASISK